jgi:hypothetical protein
MRAVEDEDGKPSLMRYHLMTVIDGTEEELQHLRDIVERASKSGSASADAFLFLPTGGLHERRNDDLDTDTLLLPHL